MINRPGKSSGTLIRQITTFKNAAEHDMTSRVAHPFDNKKDMGTEVKLSVDLAKDIQCLEEKYDQTKAPGSPEDLTASELKDSLSKMASASRESLNTKFDSEKKKISTALGKKALPGALLFGIALPAMVITTAIFGLPALGVAIPLSQVLMPTIPVTAVGVLGMKHMSKSSYMMEELKRADTEERKQDHTDKVDARSNPIRSHDPLGQPMPMDEGISYLAHRALKSDPEYKKAKERTQSLVNSTELISEWNTV